MLPGGSVGDSGNCGFASCWPRSNSLVRVLSGEPGFFGVGAVPDLMGASSWRGLVAGAAACIMPPPPPAKPLWPSVRSWYPIFVEPTSPSVLVIWFVVVLVRLDGSISFGSVSAPVGAPRVPAALLMF